MVAQQNFKFFSDETDMSSFEFLFSHFTLKKSLMEKTIEIAEFTELKVILFTEKKKSKQLSGRK